MSQSTKDATYLSSRHFFVLYKIIKYIKLEEKLVRFDRSFHASGKPRRTKEWLIMKIFHSRLFGLVLIILHFFLEGSKYNRNFNYITFAFLKKVIVRNVDYFFLEINVSNLHFIV